MTNRRHRAGFGGRGVRARWGRAALALLACAVLAAACTSGGKSNEPEQGGGPTPSRPGGRAGSGADGAEVSLTYDEAAPDVVVAAVRPPTGATEMQIGIDPTFATSQWQPVAAQARVPVTDTGYVMVFARFRAGSNAAPNGQVAAGIDVDPDWAAATASASGAPHRASSVGLVAPDVLDIRIETGRIVHGMQEAYTFAAPREGDQLADGDGGKKIVIRDGAMFGTQVANGLDVLKRPDTMVGRAVDTKLLDKASGYSIASSADGAFGSGKAPSKVTRTTEPIGYGKGADGTNLLPVEHEVFLKLSSPLQPGAEYTITFADGAVEPVKFTFDGHGSRSPALHVNQLGFKPRDITKVAYLSAYDGATNFTYVEGTPFDVVDTATGSTVLSGKSHKRTAPSGGEGGKGKDLTGAQVHELDFSSLSRVGRYRVCVATIGCSYDFAVSETDTWQRAVVDVARSAYHQRSGTALAEPYTSATRPRSFNPDDGIVAVQTSVTLMASTNGLAEEGDVFADLAKAPVGAKVDGAWGGHFDAGDWDRRVQHLWYLREAIQLVDSYPNTFEHLDLGIPESRNAMPDLIDEGLWDLDLYKRLQQPDGGIRGGIESDEHPLDGQTSWTQTQKLYVYAADPWSSYIYAGVAADAARTIRRYDAARADGYQQSALAAMAWAERQAVPANFSENVAKQRATAAAALYRLTGDTRWQDVFIAASPFAKGPVDLLSCDAHQFCDAAMEYAQTDLPTVRADVKTNVIASFTRNADRLVAFQDSTLFGWTMEHPEVPLIFGLGPGTPKVEGLLRAYLLTKDRRYCSAALRSASFSMGGNPLDTVFMTGIGRQNVRYPLIVDSISGGVPVWPGTPVFGMHDFNRPNGETWISQYFLRPAGTKPDPAALPFLREWFDLSNVAPMTEYTIYQSHAPALFAYGNLAAMQC
ncbi:MAG TPA: cellulase N-terminal Ig-like domain-containing protein [Acidimicrobiales bacterium]|nr:cellulase N-terminal Ig-like domain-containing protein [Acidimicrobiales bacterium]